MRRGYVNAGCAPVAVTWCVAVVAVVAILFSMMEPWQALLTSLKVIVVLAATFGVMAGVRR